MKLPQKPANLAATLDSNLGAGPARLYNSLVLSGYLLQQIDASNHWVSDIVALLATQPTGDLSAMGFPLDWQTRPMWK